jgi:hypothetical protein
MKITPTLNIRCEIEHDPVFFVQLVSVALSFKGYAR